MSGEKKRKKEIAGRVHSRAKHLDPIPPSRSEGRERQRKKKSLSFRCVAFSIQSVAFQEEKKGKLK
jgi:hypothetical protein